MAVRRESVEIQVKSDLARIAARDAAAVKGLANTLDRLNRTGVQSERANKRISDSLSQVAGSTDVTDRSARRASTSINQLTGRLRVAADVASILGPALIPIGAVGIPALTGLANQFGFAAAAGGTALLAFQGVGEAVEAMNEYAFAPTEANAVKLEESLARLSPQAQEFAQRIGEMRAELVATRDAAAEGLFPELTPAMDDFEGLLGRVQPVLTEIGSATGQMLADGVASLNSDRWQPFFDFLGREARPVLVELGQTVGDFTHGLSELWMAFQPLNRDMSGWLAGAADGFDAWASGLSETEGFQAFVDYIRTNGPQVADTLGALSVAVVDIVSAAAPLGGPVLAGVEAFADAVSAVADSDLGTPIFTMIAGMAVFNRAMALGRSSVRAFGQTRGNLASLGAGIDDLGSRAGRTGGAIGRMTRTAGGVLAVAGAVGLLGDALAGATGAKVDTNNLARDVEALSNGADPKLLDQVGNSLAYMAGWQNKAAEPVHEVVRAVGGLVGLGGDTPMDNAKNNIKALDEQLASLVESGNAEEAEQAFQRVMEAATGSPEGTSFADSVRDDLLGSFTGYRTALENASAANDGYAGSTDTAAASAAEAAANVNRLAQEMRTQASEALAAFDAQTQWGQAVADAREQAKTGAKGVDEMTEAGRGNRTALAGLASAWTTQSQAVKNNIGEYQSARGEFVNVAEQMGLTRGQAQRLANQMLEMPRKIVSTFVASGLKRSITDSVTLGGLIGELNGATARPSIIANTAGAASALGGIIGMLGNIRSKEVTITTYLNTVRTGRTLGGQIGMSGALGMLHPEGSPWVSSFADGGIDRANQHLPMIAPPGPVRIWAEPETGGESYIPHANDHRRPRAREILEQTATLLGGEVEWYARGGMHRLSRRQMERDSVRTAMRSEGSGRTVVIRETAPRGPVQIRGTLNTKWGPAEVEGMIEDRIQDYRDADDDYAHSQSQRVRG